MINRYSVIGWVKKNPTLWSFFWKWAHKVAFLLPHDASYYGFRHFSKPAGGLFLDVGANNGITALGIHKLLPEYRIFSVEADKRHVPALDYVKHKVEHFDYAIIAASDASADIIFYTPKLDGVTIHSLTSTDLDFLKISLARDFGEERATHVVYESSSIKAVPLDQLALSPDLIKIDVEGHEISVLRGLENTITTCRPVVLLEFTQKYFATCEIFLAQKNYGFWTYDREADRFLPFGQQQRDVWGDTPLQVNVFCVPNEINIANAAL